MTMTRAQVYTIITLCAVIILVVILNAWVNRDSPVAADPVEPIVVVDEAEAVEVKAYSEKWKLGDAWLLGNSRSGGGGEFQYVRESSKEGQSSTLKYEFSHDQYELTDILGMKYSLEPEFVLVTFELDADEDGFGRSSVEYVIDPVSKKFYELWPKLITDPNRPYYEHPYYVETPNKQPEPIQFDQAKRWNDGMYSIEDDRGTLLYVHGDHPRVQRYADLHVTDTKHFEQNWPDQSKGELLLYLRMRNFVGLEYVTHVDYADFYPFEASVWNGEWQMFYTNAFFRTNESKLETVLYENLWNNQYAMKKKEYAFGTASFTGQTGPMLHFTDQGEQFDVSLYDAIRYYPINDSQLNSIEHIQAGKLAADRIVRGDYATEQTDELKRFTELPEMLLIEHNSNEPLPDPVIRAVEEKYLSGSGDFVPSILYRKAGEDWYVLVDKQFHVFGNNQLIEVGMLPVGTTTIMSNYSVGIGVQDLTKLGEHWYVADTLGNRIIKLDEQLNLIKSIDLPVPSKIKSIDHGQLEVISLQGISVISEQLEIVSARDSQTEQVSEERIVRREIVDYDIHPSSYYVEPSSQVIWYYESPGYLNQYQSETKELHRQYIGMMNNGYGEPRLVPHQNNIILLLDNQAIVYNKNGAWIKTIVYPRVVPDGIYVMTTDGENSFYLDEQANVMYLVQGFRIIAINLLTDEVTTIFRQSNSNIGKILVHDDQVIFSVQSNYEHRYNKDIPGEQLLTELCVIELSSGRLSRYSIEGFWLTHSINDDGHIVLTDTMGQSYNTIAVTLPSDH